MNRKSNAGVILLLCTVLSYKKVAGQLNGFMKDSEFEQIKNSDTGSVVLPVFNRENNLILNAAKSLNAIRGNLKDQEIGFYLVPCDTSKLKICENKHPRVILYQNGDVVNYVEISLLQSPGTALPYVLHKMNPDILVEISNKDNLDMVLKENAAEKDIILFHINELGKEDHFRAVVRSMELQSMYDTFYIKENPYSNNKVKAWFIRCKDVEPNTKCMETDINTDSFQPKSFYEFTKRIKNAYGDERQDDDISEEEFHSYQNLYSMVYMASESAKNIYLLVAGVGKEEKANMLLEELEKKGDTRVILFTMETPSLMDVRYYIENNKIFTGLVTVASGKFILTEVGFLKTDSIKEFEMKMQKVMSSENKIEVEITDTQPDILEELSVFEIQDDPMAFSVHQSKATRNLYLYDHKTLSRLTDKTFVSVTTGMEYAVILFTLEFNARALAALSIYAEIHQEYKENPAIESPLHRVECYDWPDVCQKMNITTTPRMFFYNPVNNKDLIEYKGMWEKNTLKNVILRQSLPTVIEMSSSNDFKDFPKDFPFKIVFGLFEDDMASKVFHEAAMSFEEVVFIEARGKAANEISEAYGIQKENTVLFAVDNNAVKETAMKFETEEDIRELVKSAFYRTNGEIFELTIKNYAEVLADPKPLIMYFKNYPGVEKENDEKAKNVVTSIAKNEDTQKDVIITWIDSHNNKSIGYNVANIYNQEEVQNPIAAYFNKKNEVFVTSLIGVDEKKLSLWLTDCRDNKIKSTYTLSDEPWAPRLDGHDFLMKLKRENKYPTEFRHGSKPKEDEEPAHSGGRLRAKMHQNNMNTEMPMKKPAHSEL